MKSIWQKLHKLGDFLHIPDFPNWVLAILVLALILRIPSFFEPYYYGDEMIYLTLGQGIRHGLLLYRDIFDNKPPLLYLTAALAGNLFWFKTILAFWNIVTIAFFYKLAAKLFAKKESVQMVSTFIFAVLTTIPLFEGSIVNAELFMVGFTIIALYILLSENLNSKKIFLAGILFGIGTLFKVPAALDAPIIVVYWLITTDFKDWGKVIKHSLVLFSGFILPIIISLLFFFLKGSLSSYITAAFLQNVGYLSSYRPGDVQKSFLVRNAPLLIRALIVFVGVVILYLSRKKLSKNFILFCVWTFLGLFAVTLSERPYPHYFIQVVAPVSFLLGLFFADKSVEQALTVLPLALSFFVPVYYKFYYYNTSAYYQRFINFATRKTDKTEYFQDFGSTVNRNYQIADFLVNSSLPNDKVFIWNSDSATIYALSRRLPPIKYVADYHVTDYSNTTEIANEIIRRPPKFIILASSNSYPELNGLIKEKYLLVSQIQNADIYSLINLAPQAK